MSTIPQLESRESELVEKVKPILKELEDTRRQLSEEKSREFIRVNQITLADVQPCDGDGLPYFGMVSTFATWLRRTECPKRFAVWNGQLHFVSDLLSGRFTNTGALIEHVGKEGA